MSNIHPKGADGDHVDVYLGPHLASKKVFIVDQKDDGRFDEHKAFLGFGNEPQVKSTFKKAFSDGKGHVRLGKITQMSIEEFKNWLKGSPTTPSGNRKTIYIVRHGSTKMNNSVDVSADRIRGWMNVPLTDEGREEARKAAQKLNDVGIEYIVSSDLDRAHETAEIVGNVIGVKPITTHKLRPWDLGKMTGSSTKVALPQIANYIKNKPSTKVPEGESFDQFKDRAFQGVADAIRGAKGKTLLIVTHHRLERLLRAWDAAGQPFDREIDLKVFQEKGDPPGGAESMKIDFSALIDDDKIEKNRQHKSLSMSAG